MAEAVLTLRRVSRFYGERAVLKNIDVAVLPGQALLVVGPNGAGKSTLLRLVAGLLPPSEGDIESGLAPGEIGYLGHKTLIYPRLTARANLAFWQTMFGLPRDDAPIEAVLARVGLSRFADEEAGVFSRGMSQRLSLARVFLTAPRLLLLDEPASGLDPASAAMLRREIRAAADAGASVVWVSHNVVADLPVCDRVLLLRGHRVAYDGAARDFDVSGLAGEATC
ncbi:ABC transporter involved in cytochrome c biogenesis, ATPase component CcmA [Desulfovibrio sp. DV]|uniref:heme ABC exporter ATP-binding protein CcmA n=1 Tax=Desulfovibrio sp. DV TaxID=1844708 RepID=UPI00094B89EB|nr:heme ABC exporter ATP-binding protein CcmA [Desulfovibrio sp. DV]OLN31070.1 ABC transporter involved in cytochrome c biogenesis, ATPase component CcmA [Desulfovibrio sp. DV]